MNAEKTAMLRLSELLVGFTYGEMMDVARRFCSVAACEVEPARDLTTATGWAELLHDTAEVEIEEATPQGGEDER